VATILLTGATGAVGSSLAPLLRKMGHKLICLVRGDDPVARLRKALGNVDGIAVFSGDVVLVNLGVCNSEMEKWQGKIDKIIHCASSIKFDEASADETTRINVCGTQNVLDFARIMEIPEVHYVSTAYVAGDAEVFSESDVDIGQKCRNVYERTKLQAEKMVKGWSHGRNSIYRLGIVVGDTVTGWTPSFNGFYVFACRYWQFKQTMQKDGLGKYETRGIGFDRDGALQLPLWGRFSSDSTLNIIPVDWTAGMLGKLAEIPASGRIFHITDPQPPKVRWLNDASMKHMGITGFRYGNSPDGDPRSLLGRFQTILDRGIGPYIPYITHEAKFEVSNLPKLLGGGYIPPQIVNEKLIAKWLDYAISVGFGRRQ
jgi:nucleoside-diphosphate-sugar epimerase